MADKKTKKHNRFMLSVLMMVVSVLVLGSIIFGNTIGGLCLIFGEFFMGVFGLSAYVFFPLLMILSVMRMLGMKTRPIVSFFGSLLILSLTLLVHLMTSMLPDGSVAPDVMAFEEYASACYSGELISFGGMLAALIVHPVYHLVGVWGSYAIYFVLMALSCVFVATGLFSASLNRGNKEELKAEKEKKKLEAQAEKEKMRLEAQAEKERKAKEKAERKEAKKAEKTSSVHPDNDIAYEGDKKPRVSVFDNIGEENSAQELNSAGNGRASENGRPLNEKRNGDRVKSVDVDKSIGKQGEGAVRQQVNSAKEVRNEIKLEKSSGTEILNERSERNINPVFGGNTQSDVDAHELLFGENPTVASKNKAKPQTAREILYSPDVIEASDRRKKEKLKNNPLQSYISGYESEKSNSVQERPIKTAERSSFDNVDYSQGLPPKIIHEQNTSRGAEFVDANFSRRTVATAESMRNTVYAQPSQKKARSSVPQNKDLLGYKVEPVDNKALPPIINGEMFAKENPDKVEKVDAQAEKSVKEQKEQQAFNSYMGRYGYDTKPSDIAGRAEIINADDYADKNTFGSKGNTNACDADGQKNNGSGQNFRTNANYPPDGIHSVSTGVENIHNTPIPLGRAVFTANGAVVRTEPYPGYYEEQERKNAMAQSTVCNSPVSQKTNSPSDFIANTVNNGAGDGISLSSSAGVHVKSENKFSHGVTVGFVAKNDESISLKNDDGLSARNDESVSLKREEDFSVKSENSGSFIRSNVNSYEKSDVNGKSEVIGGKGVEDDRYELEPSFITKVKKETPSFSKPEEKEEYSLDGDYADDCSVSGDGSAYSDDDEFSLSDLDGYGDDGSLKQNTISVAEVFDGFSKRNDNVELSADNEEKTKKSVAIVGDSKGSKTTMQMKVSEFEGVGLFKERTSKRIPYKAPPLSLLHAAKAEALSETQLQELNIVGNLLVQSLSEFNIKAEVKNIICGPSVALYEMELASGIPIKKVLSINDDIARSISADGALRIIPHIIGKNYFGIEVPLKNCRTVYLREMIESKEFNSGKGDLTLALGIDIEGNHLSPDLSKMPHLLIGGSTGSGKSCLLNSIILSFLYKYSPEELRFILVDPKRVEFIMYSGMPHMLMPEPLNSAEKALNALEWLCAEMERRYEIFGAARVKKIADYNKILDKTKYEPMPRIVLVVDELSELVTYNKQEIEARIHRLAQLARAAGIHLIIATQRPSVDIITGTIKSNLPTRVAMKVSSGIDSKTILDMVGAEKLVRKGEMLLQLDGNISRLQGPLVEDEEVEAIISYLKENNPCIFDEDVEKIINTEKKPNGSKGGNSSDDDEDEDSREKDPYFVEVLKFAIAEGCISIARIQRQFSVGFGRAGRLFQVMENKGYLGKADQQNKARPMLLTAEQFNEQYGDEYGRI